MEDLGLSRDRVARYVRAVERMYRGCNPYHCAAHAADVVQTTAAMLLADGLTARLTRLEALACLLAAVVHDVDHRGVNNEYLIRTRDDLALTYNDLSVNESHHLATAFRIMRQPGHDLLSCLSPEDYAFVRGLVVDVVKATDMQEHHRLAAALKEDIRSLGPDLSTWDAVARGHAVAALMHAADISNAAKPAPVSVEWAKRIAEEFWQQGDRERELGLAVQPLFDRARANVPASQIAFLQLFVKPSFELLSHIAPSSGAAALRHYECNLARWGALARSGARGFGDGDEDNGGGGGGGGGGEAGREARQGGGGGGGGSVR
ncbi:MAG: hypothetical protein J3K34DRAFT_423476 [Monoraphidium minutum]|nr:MAG: hypothetical protein J3K34DRAFT_423476 [Monoraphidium minutum]